MLDEQRYRRLNDAERAVHDAAASAELDAALAGLARQFAENAANCRAAVDAAARSLEESRGDEFHEPRKLAALARAEEMASTWQARAAAASRGHLLMTQVELGDVSYMNTCQGLISSASHLDRVAYERTP